MSRIVAALAIVTSLAWAGSARAHISLERGGTHKSRYGDGAGVIKAGPCGMEGGKRGDNVYTYEPGETITVKWVEYVPHPGYFRFAFDTDGDDDFKDPVSISPLDPDRGCPAKVLSGDGAKRDQCDHDDFYNSSAVLPEMDKLFPHVERTANMMYSADVKLPDIECDNCTLQLIQVMEDPVHGPYNLEVSGSGDLGDIYHQCIDIVLKRGATSSMAGAAGSSNAGAAQPSAGNAAASSKAEAAKSDGGCTVSPGVRGSAAPWLMMWSLAMLFCAYRRRLWTRPFRALCWAFARR